MMPAQAYAIASQWGSYINAGDPGAVFYTFPVNDARPQSEAHRAQLQDYAVTLALKRINGVPLSELTPDVAADIRELRALHDFFATADLRP